MVLSHAERHRGRGSRSAAELEGVMVSAPALAHSIALVSLPNSLDFCDAHLRAHHEHVRAAYGISPGDEVDLRGRIRTFGKLWFPSCAASSETWSLLKGGRGDQSASLSTWPSSLTA